MQKEIIALESNNTRTLTTLPPKKKAIDSKWLYKMKYKSSSEIKMYKARLVTKGFTHIQGIDFHETITPVTKLVFMRTMLDVAVKKNRYIHQLDVNNVFLHGDLDEEVYMKVMQGLAKENDACVCQLSKTLYELVKAY